MPLSNVTDSYLHNQDLQIPELQNKLEELMYTLQLDDAPAGGALVVYHQGMQVAAVSIGQATASQQWCPNSLSLNYSTGKGVLTTLVHILVSRGMLDYQAPIAHYWQDFARNGKADITLEQVLTHQSGLFDISSITNTPNDMLDWAMMLNRVEEMATKSPAGKSANTDVQSCYSALVSGWVLGGLIEKVTGLELNEALDTYLANPLGVSGEMYFGVPRSQVNEVATLAKHFDGQAQIQSQQSSNEANQDLTTSSSKTSCKPSHKPRLRQDTQQTLEAYQTLPCYACWEQLSSLPDAVQSRSVQSRSIQSKQVHSDKAHLSKGLGTLDIVKLYLEMHKVNLQDYKRALMPAGVREDFNYYDPQALMAKIPAAGNVASASALAKMYAMLAGGGSWQGQQLISQATFAKLKQVRVTGRDAIMAAAHPSSMQWRLGYHRLFTRCHQAPNAFGHMGYNGSGAWCDLDRQLAVAYVHNYDVTMSTDVRQFAINEAVLSHFPSQ